MMISEKPRKIVISRYDMIDAPHWYVTCDNDKRLKQKKFLDIEDAKEYARSLTTEKNIEILG